MPVFALKGKTMSSLLYPISLAGMKPSTHDGELSWTLKTRTISLEKAAQLKGSHITSGVLILGQLCERENKLSC